MHTVVFGWFGGSAVWFIPLLWRLVKSVLPGGAGLRGPGTIRLWLGFVCVMLASCTLEASLINVTGINGFGHALAAGLGHLLGHIGTPLAALALFLISLPWLIDFQWRDFAAWADSAFGLGLSRGLARRDEEARRHRSVDDGLPSHISPATNTMAPKSKGRYARPTVWRPPASGRGTAGGAGAASGVSGVAGAGGLAAGADASARGAGASWRTGAAAARNPQAAQAEPVLRTGAIAADNTPFMPTEPIAPAGWLREPAPRAAASLNGQAPGRDATAAARDAALQVGRRAAGEQRQAGSLSAGAGLAATVGMASAGTAVPATPAAVAATAAAVASRTLHGSTAARAASGALSASAPSIARSTQGASRPASILGSPAGGPVPVNRTPLNRQPLQAAQHAGGINPSAGGARRTAPAYTRPMATAQKVSPPASVQETLRSIAENAARWTDLAGVSLARNRSVEDGISAEGAESETSFDTGLAGVAGAGPVTGAGEPSSDTVEHASGGYLPSHPANGTVGAVGANEAVQPLETVAIGTAHTDAASQPAAFEVSKEPVVQWPIEPPVIHIPAPVATVPAAAAAQSTVAGPTADSLAATKADVPAFAPAFASSEAVASNSAAPLAEPANVLVAAPVAPAPASTPAPTTTPTPFQIFAAQLHADDGQPHTRPPDSASTMSTPPVSAHPQPATDVEPPVARAPLHSADLAATAATASTATVPQVANPVVTHAAAPWETGVASAMPQPGASPLQQADVVSVSGETTPPLHSTNLVDSSGPSASYDADMQAHPALPDIIATLDESEEAESPRELTSLTARIASTLDEVPPENAAEQVSNVVRFPRLAAHGMSQAAVVAAEPSHFAQPADVDVPAIEPEVFGTSATPGESSTPGSPLVQGASATSAVPSSPMNPVAAAAALEPLTTSAAYLSPIAPVAESTRVEPVASAPLATSTAPVVPVVPVTETTSVASATSATPAALVAPVAESIPMEPVAPVPLATPALPVTPVVESTPFEPVALTPLAAPTAPVTSAAQTTPIEPVAMAQLATPPTPVEPVAEATPIEPLSPASLASAAAPVAPFVEPTPVEAVATAPLATPTASVAPVAESIPFESVTTPSLATPTAPVAPVAEATPFAPVNPVPLATPTAPVALATPASAANPATPAVPATPVAPVADTTPVAPVALATPVIPTVPVAPTLPASSTVSATPAALVTTGAPLASTTLEIPTAQTPGTAPVALAVPAVPAASITPAASASFVTPSASAPEAPVTNAAFAAPSAENTHVVSGQPTPPWTSAPTAPTTRTASAAPANNANDATLAAPTAPQPATEAPSDQPAAAQRPPLRGHAPANGFEFRAPAASLVELPTLDLLAPADSDIEPVSEEKLIETGLLIEQRLQEFKVPVTVVGASAGPVITRFEVEPALGVRGSQIVGLMKDLSRGLGLTSIRVVETIPGKTCMGLELPNAKRQTIRLSEILEASVYQNSHSQLTLAMGKDITGHPVVADLAKAPHMLVAGTTGSGKSVAINAMICSLLFKATPEEVRLIMIDPKMLELSVYEGIPHLLAPVVTDMKLAANALNWCVGEMEKRYRLMSAVGVRNLAGFNQKIRDTEAKGKKLGNPFSLTPDAPEPLAPLPLIVVVIDELADLMMVAGKKIEELIARLAQKARAAGIHLILATQRPSVDVITGLIKANIPTRVAFQVSSKIDSRTILDQMGAESLLGQGDMLFLPPGTGYPQRVHGAFVADEEVHAIVEYLKQFGEPQYEEGILDGPASDGGAAQDLFGESPDAEADPLYDEAVAFVVRTRRASISSVQRQLRIGYNRAARLVEQMETAGLVSAMSINGSREVLAPGPAE